MQNGVNSKSFVCLTNSLLPWQCLATVLHRHVVLTAQALILLLFHHTFRLGTQLHVHDSVPQSDWSCPSSGVGSQWLDPPRVTRLIPPMSVCNVQHCTSATCSQASFQLQYKTWFI